MGDATALHAVEQDAPSADDWFDCITQDPEEPAGADYLAVCTVKAELLGRSQSCIEEGCGGHPICRPCFDLAVEKGWAAT